MPIVIEVTIVAEMNKPIVIPTSAFLIGIPNINAARVPVQAPVTGSGMPTNNAKPR